MRIYALYKIPAGAVRILSAILFTLLLPAAISAQEFPPRPVEVSTTSPLIFGAFTIGATGGTITVTPGSSRTSSGDVILLNLGFPYSPALLEITANPGSVISILKGADVVLPGSNGGSITLTIGDTNPVSPFVTSVTPPLTTPLYVGGILTVGNILANPAGSYSGTFDITFIQE